MKFNERPYDAFISYAHEDTEFAARVHEYLRDRAKLSVWRDNFMPGAAPVSDAINRNIKNSRALLLVYSKHTRNSEWVKDELRKAIGEKNSSRGQFKLLGIITDGESIPDGTAEFKCIENRHRTLDTEFCTELLSAFYPFQDAFTISASLDIFISRSWRDEEAERPDAICKAMARSGFRLIGNSKDWKNFDSGERVKAIIKSCGALVAIAPYRPREADQTSRYILQELATARELSLPYLIVADDEVPICESLTASAIDGRIIRTSELDRSPSTMSAIGSLVREAWRDPPHEHHGFLATDFKQNTRRSQLTIGIAEKVTGMRCLTGREFQTSGAQDEIIRRISNALYVIGDISNLDVSRGNVLLEIGIAIGAGVEIEIVSQRDNSRPHHDIFMFRGREIKYGKDDADIIAHVHAICRRYRRRIFNWEFEDTGLLG